MLTLNQSFKAGAFDQWLGESLPAPSSILFQLHLIVNDNYYRLRRGDNWFSCRHIGAVSDTGSWAMMAALKNDCARCIHIRIRR